MLLAFRDAKVERGCVSLRQARLIDDYDFDPLSSEQAWNSDWKGHWSNIPAQDLEEFRDTLNHFDPMAHEYYLAGFIWAALQKPNGTIWENVLDHLTLPVLSGTRGFKKFEHLNLEQRLAVTRFIEFAYEVTPKIDHVSRAELLEAAKAWREFSEGANK